jgi:hypothetical protein
MRRFPPSIRSRGGLVKDFSASLTCVSNHHAFFVKHFSDIFEIIFTRLRAIIFFDVREIVFVSPLRRKIVTAFTSLSMPHRFY